MSRRTPGTLEMNKVGVGLETGGNGATSWPCHVFHDAPTGSVQTTQISAKKEDKQVPESAAPQNPKFKATPGPQPPTRRRFLSEVDKVQDPQPVWDKEPQLWQGFLTQELWKIFMDSCQKNQQEHRGEGFPQVRGTSQAQAFFSLSLPLPSPLPGVMATEKLLELVSTLDWNHQGFTPVPSLSTLLPHPCTLTSQEDPHGSREPPRVC